MRAASIGFAATVAGSHTIATRVDALLGGIVIREGLPLLSGAVTFDRRRKHFASARLVFADKLGALLPTDPDSPLSPFGYELRVNRGVRLTATTSELLALGTFPIQVGDGGDLGSVSLQLDDRSRTVSDDILEDTVVIPEGTNYIPAIISLAPAGFADDAVTAITELTTPRLVYRAGTDRWTAMQALGLACGMEVRYDGLGRLSIQPEPSVTDNPVATLHEDVNVTAASIAADRRNSVNRVIVIGRNANNSAAIIGVATDTESDSAYGSDFGRKQLRLEMAEVGSLDAAAAAAAAKLAQRQGITLTVSSVAVPDPRREASDVVALTVSRLGIANAPHIIETLVMDVGPDGGDQMTLRGRYTDTEVTNDPEPPDTGGGGGEQGTDTFDGGSMDAQGTDTFDGGSMIAQGTDTFDGGAI